MSSSSSVQSLSQAYQETMLGEIGAFNLDEHIDEAAVEMCNPIKVIRIRRLATDELYPYSADTFVQWYIAGHHSDPVTQEDLSYLKRRVEFKLECIMYADQEHLQKVCKNLDASVALFRSYIQSGCGLQSIAPIYHIPLRMCCGLDTLRAAGYVHENLDDATAATIFLMQQQVKYSAAAAAAAAEKDVTNNLWLLRASNSAVGRCMKHATVVTFSRVHNGSYLEVRHNRYIHIDGIGWYSLTTKNIADGSAASSMIFITATSKLRGVKEPVCVTLIDLLEYICQQYKLHLSNMVPASQSQGEQQKTEKS